MRNLIKLGAVMAFLVAGCTTTKNWLTEPERSEFYYTCLSQSVQVTVCGCMEGKAVYETGMTSIGDKSEEEQLKFIAALQRAFPACIEESKKAAE